MSEWWTYSLSSFLLFSPRTYYRLFELYNLAIWPAQFVALALGAVILVLWLRGARQAGSAAAGVLAACWAWVAWAYLLQRYDTINFAARYFAAGFALEALLLLWTGLRGQLLLQPPRGAIARAGLCIFLFALVVQPLAAPLLGRPWTQAEIFGVAPDPTAVATLGIVLASTRMSLTLLVIPLLWCAISAVTLWAMQSPEAWVAGVVVALAILFTAWTTPPRPRAPAS